MAHPTAAQVQQNWRILALRVDYPLEEPDEPTTSGRGRFDLRSLADALSDYQLPYDTPPHDRVHYERHLQDSLSLVAVLAQLENPLRIADVGSGAGLPGVPLAVVLPGAHVTLIERSAKKSRFLQRVAMELGLPNVDVVCDDVVNVTAKYDVVVSRAVMAPDRLWPLAFRILRAEGHMVVLDRVRDAGAGAPVDSVEGFPGGIVTRRSWSQMPESGALHGVLVVRCQAN